MNRQTLELLLKVMSLLNEVDKLIPSDHQNTDIRELKDFNKRLFDETRRIVREKGLDFGFWYGATETAIHKDEDGMSFYEAMEKNEIMRIKQPKLGKISFLATCMNNFSNCRKKFRVSRPYDENEIYICSKCKKV